MILYVAEHVYNAQLTKSLKERILHAACRTTVHDPYKDLIIWDISKSLLGMFSSCSKLLLESRDMLKEQITHSVNHFTPQTFFFCSGCLKPER